MEAQNGTINIPIKKQYQIVTASGHVSESHKTLKHEESFAIFDNYGDIKSIFPRHLGKEGIYYHGTRHISHFELYICGTKPLLLSSSIKEDNSLFTVDLANPDIFEYGAVVLKKGMVHIMRSKFLYNNSYYEKIHLQNFSTSLAELDLTILFESDFADIFEVRGAKRTKKGIKLPPSVSAREVTILYKGADNITRRTTVEFSITPATISPNQATFKFRLKPKQKRAFHIRVTFGEKSTDTLPYRKALFFVRKRLAEWERKSTLIHTSNEQFNEWLQRSFADIAMLTTKTPYGEYPYAGIPWFTTIFGRDGIITAYECLWINPEIARGTLATLAALQAHEISEKEDAQPGKIIHEIREGEMANTGDIPFKRYCGSVDATPLFVILAGRYYDRTNDKEFIKSIWDNIEAAVKWIDDYGDMDGDGFVEYMASKDGLINKGWKDSEDSVFHKNGELAEGPIALVEVQGYVYRAKKEASKLAGIMGKKELKEKWEREAEQIKSRINLFWSNRISFYGMAFDGKKELCEIKTSNPGHLLFSEAITREKAKIVAETLFEKEFFSGWGIRTLSSRETLYNPLSYHNGSIWPHDNAMIAMGLSLYGFKELALRIMKGLFDASTFFDMNRLPELFCGFPRRPHEGPTLYPVACHPQAWASGSVFLLLQAVLGLSFKRNTVKFSHPTLPEFLDEVWIKNLKVGGSSVDLYLKRYGMDVVINVTRKEGDVELIIEK